MHEGFAGFRSRPDPGCKFENNNEAPEPQNPGH